MNTRAIHGSDSMELSRGKQIWRALAVALCGATALSLMAMAPAIRSNAISLRTSDQAILGVSGHMTLGQTPLALRHAVQRAVGKSRRANLLDSAIVNLGYSAAMANGVAVVGAPGTNNSAGAVSFYALSNGTWKQQATIEDPRGAAMDEFGWSVAITSSSVGTYAAIGAQDNNSSFDYVYVYKLSRGKWREQAALPDPGASSQDNFGSSVAISGSTLVVGASCVNIHIGEFWIYEHFTQGWVLTGHENDPSNKSKDFFGQSLSISGNSILAGATDKAYVFTETLRHRWYRTATIPNPGSAKDNFGFVSGLSGTTAIVGAPGGVAGAEISSPLSAGATYVYTLGDTPGGKKWSLEGRLIAPPGVLGDQFGYSIALVNNIMVIGMPLEGKTGCGRAFVFKAIRGKWRLQAQILNPHSTSHDEFGFSVAESGSTAIYGAPFANASQGAVHFKNLP